MSSDDDDEFTLSVYNKAAVKSQFNKNLNQLKSQLKKPSNNVVVKDSKKDEEIIEEILHEETPVESVKPSNNKISKNGKKNKGKVRNGTPGTSPEQSGDDTDSSDIVVETVLPPAIDRSLADGLDNDDSFEVIHEHVLSKSPAYATRRSKRLRKELEQQGKAPVLPKPKPKKPNKKRRGKSIADYFTSQEKKLVEDNIVVIHDNNSDIEECSDDDINPEISIKINWKSVKIKKFQLRKYQKFSKIFEILMDEEKVQKEKIWLTFKGEKIKPSDTPESLNLKIYDFIDGGVLSETSNSLNASVNNCEDSDSDDRINIKFQDDKRNVVKLKLKETDRMKIVMLKYAEQIEVPIEKIKFLFDGEILDPNETPISLGLDNDEVIDVKFNL